MFLLQTLSLSTAYVKVFCQNIKVANLPYNIGIQKVEKPAYITAFYIWLQLFFYYKQVLQKIPSTQPQLENDEDVDETDNSTSTIRGSHAVVGERNHN